MFVTHSEKNMLLSADRMQPCSTPADVTSGLELFSLTKDLRSGREKDDERSVRFLLDECYSVALAQCNMTIKWINGCNERSVH